MRRTTPAAAGPGGCDGPGAGGCDRTAGEGLAQPWTPAPVGAGAGNEGRPAEAGAVVRRREGRRPSGSDGPAAAGGRGAGPGDGSAWAETDGEGERVRRRARRWLERARRAATAHLERARREADALRRQAWQEGVARGEAEGRARWEAARRRLEEQVASQRRDLEARYRQLLAASAEPLLELALAIARRVAGQQLATDPAALRAQVEEALSRLGAEGARVLLHPESLAQLEGTAPLAPGVELAGDLTLAPGDFRVETPRGQIDGRVAAQVDRLGQVLREQGLGAVPPVEGEAAGDGRGPAGMGGAGAAIRPAGLPPAAAVPGDAEGREPA
ncbi:MAG TPA: FliH/SctL family protein [Thermaerobacter sp.]